MRVRKIEQEKVFMNTIIHITLFSDKPTIYTQQKIQEAFSCFDQVVKKYTRFSPKSELSALNNSGGKPMKVSDEFYYLIEYMLELSKLTNGNYDPTIIDLLETYGYGENRNFKELDDPNLYQNIQTLVEKRPSPSQIKLNKNNKTVQFAPRQRIDLGSIGKGYAIDLAYDVLEDFPAFMINAGGDIRVKGPKPDGEKWKVGLYKSQLPNKALPKDDYTGIIELENGSVCGSGGWARKVRFFHHLLNPKTGFPIIEITQTYVIAPKAIEADSWATVLFTMGKSGLQLLRDKGFRGILIDQKGKISQTARII